MPIDPATKEDQSDKLSNDRELHDDVWDKHFAEQDSKIKEAWQQREQQRENEHHQKKERAQHQELQNASDNQHNRNPIAKTKPELERDARIKKAMHQKQITDKRQLEQVAMQNVKNNNTISASATPNTGNSKANQHSR